MYQVRSSLEALCSNLKSTNAHLEEKLGVTCFYFLCNYRLQHYYFPRKVVTMYVLPFDILFNCCKLWNYFEPLTFVTFSQQCISTKMKSWEMMLPCYGNISVNCCHWDRDMNSWEIHLYELTKQNEGRLDKEQFGLKMKSVFKYFFVDTRQSFLLVSKIEVNT